MKKRIVFAITQLQLGGAERVLIDMVNALKDQYDITIFTLYQGDLEYQLDPKIKVVSLKEKHYSKISKEEKQEVSKQLTIASKRKELYEKYFNNKYDVEIAFLEGPVTWLLQEKGSARKIAWVHNDISKVFGKGIRAVLKKRLNQKSYTKYDQLIFVSKDNLAKFEEYFPKNKVLKQVIYNYMDLDRIIKLSKEKAKLPFSKKDINFLSVCRLTEQKGLDRLIPIHARLVEEGYSHHFYILGTGPLKEKLEDLIKEYHCEKTFHLLGSSENPYPYMLACDYFALLSYYEGYGMVLTEAKALDKSILITDTAAREALNDYENKWILKNDEQGIYEGLKEVFTHPVKKTKKAKYQNKELLKEIQKVIEG